MKQLSFLLALAAAVASCTSYESARTTHHAREYLTEDIEEQIVFNLIRAANGLPFAHYDVTTAQSAVTAKAAGEFGTEKVREKPTFRADLVVDTAIRTVTRTLTGGGSAERTNGVTINIKPIFDNPKIYARYISYLNLDLMTSGTGSGGSSRGLDDGAAKLKVVSEKTTTTKENDPEGRPAGETVEVEMTKEAEPEPAATVPSIHFGNGDFPFQSLRKSTVRPSTRKYVPRTLRRWDGEWYYIPAKYKQQFSDLCIFLVARGGAAATGGGSNLKMRPPVENFEEVRSELMRQNTLRQSD